MVAWKAALVLSGLLAAPGALAAVSTNGLCGPQNGGTTCDPNSTAYQGGCCSQYGYCGSSTAHCGTGCISGCSGAAPGSSSSSAAAPVSSARPDARCGTAFGGATCVGSPFGTCCSALGWCGNTDDHCLATKGCQSGCKGTVVTTSSKPATTTSAAAPSGTAVVPAGRCGTAFGGATCAGSTTGTCCSGSGWCGTTADHCLPAKGCQSGCTGTSTTVAGTTSSSTTSAGTTSSSTTSAGTTSSSTTSAAPTSTPSGIPTTDGSCGRTNGGTTCVGWANGGCCSMYGFCGNTAGHCGDGCQSGPCVVGAPQAPGPSPAPITNGGAFAVIGQSGVPVMHAGLLPNGRAVFLDKVEDYTQLKLPNGQYAYSSEYDPLTNTVVPLSYTTNAFCSGGVFLANGDFVSLGGNAPLTSIDPTVGDGFNAIRYITRSSSDVSLNGQNWREPGNKLASNRWYASAQTLADGKVFVASGSLNGLDPTVNANNNPTYEILSPAGITNGVNTPLDILVKNQPYYMYPFMHLLKNGNMFIFAAKSSQIFNIGGNAIVSEMPDLAGDFRTYPNTGGSVLLPLTSANNWAAKVMICGGGSYQDITSPTDPSCGVISPEAAAPTWEMDSMPAGRGMVEGVTLPSGDVLWLNGANRGAEGFELATDPTLAALLYDSTKPLGQRWTQLASSTIPRLYHSVAILLLDGTVLVAGSNPHEMPVLTATTASPYVTEFRVEKFTPPYLQGAKAALRPTAVVISSKSLPANGSTFTIKFNVPVTTAGIKISLYHGGFVTHAVHMGQRMLFLDNTGFAAGTAAQTVTVTMPPNKNVAPPGPWVVYVVADGIPAVGQFVMVI